MTVIAIQWDAGVRRRAMMLQFPDDIEYEDLGNLVPNFHHVWASKNPLLIDHGSKKWNTNYAYNLFGRDVIRWRDWKKICWMDSDKDGNTNGQEMGDPCCTWSPGDDSLKYRVWNLTHPGKASDNFTKEEVHDVTPESCSLTQEELDRVKHQQFQNQYYMMHESDLKTPDSLRWLKYPMVGMMALVVGSWSVKRGLLLDMFGVGPEGEGGMPLSPQKRALVVLAAFLWTDGIAGLTHLTFDFSPRDYPIIGNVATGFQFHHYHPSAWVVVPFWQMMSHSVPLLGFLSCFLLALPPTRPFRLFWVWTFILCFTTVLSHRWCHFPPEELPIWYRMLQCSGILMSHEHHQRHHANLVTQFSNLSGVTDFILDWLTNFIPAYQYQNWLSVTVVYFSLPIVAGAEVVQPFLSQASYRLFHNRIPKVAMKVEDDAPYHMKWGMA